MTSVRINDLRVLYVTKFSTLELLYVHDFAIYYVDVATSLRTWVSGVRVPPGAPNTGWCEVAKGNVSKILDHSVFYPDLF